MNVRLNKLLAERGVSARRKCDALIESGVVTVNGETVTAPGTRVNPDRDRITINGQGIPGRAEHRYVLLNKPVGVIATMSDPQGRRSLADLVPRHPRLFPVGRLDADTSGLLILTNDGELAHHLMHPRYGVEKFYRAVVSPRPTEVQLEKLRRGVLFEPGVRSSPARVRARDPVSRGAVIEVAIAEGRYRQVRRMCEAVGLRVHALHRWGYGPLRLLDLARGMMRDLSAEELRRLRGSSARPGGAGVGARRRDGAPAGYRSPRAHRARAGDATAFGAPKEKRTRRPAAEEPERKAPPRRKTTNRGEVIGRPGGSRRAIRSEPLVRPKRRAGTGVERPARTGRPRTGDDRTGKPFERFRREAGGSPRGGRPARIRDSDDLPARFERSRRDDARPAGARAGKRPARVERSQRDDARPAGARAGKRPARGGSGGAARPGRPGGERPRRRDRNG